jgi:NAD(P)-dependent dehydrogenase (short-subunit alcohol dehydrogenase family)
MVVTTYARRSTAQYDDVLTRNTHTGTAGLGKSSVEALIRHAPAHIYFTGRNAGKGEALIAKTRNEIPDAPLTFVPMDLASLSSVKAAIADYFRHDRLDILMCNAGIMASPPGLSKDGFEIQFATNHLGHAMVIQELIPVMLRTAENITKDVRIVNLTSTGWRAHHQGGIQYDTLQTTQVEFLGSWFRYG